MSALTSEQQKLVEENHSLLYWFLRKHNLSDELYGDAAIGLCKAAASYKPEVGVKFSHYATLCMLHECFPYTKKELPTISLYMTVPTTERITYAESVADSVDHIADTEFKSQLLARLEVLTERQLKVVYYTLLGYTLEQIGTILGITQSAAHKLLERARERLVSSHSDYHHSKSTYHTPVLIEQITAIISAY